MLMSKSPSASIAKVEFNQFQFRPIDFKFNLSESYILWLYTLKLHNTFNGLLWSILFLTKQ